MQCTQVSAKLGRGAFSQVLTPTLTLTLTLTFTSTLTLTLHPNSHAYPDSHLHLDPNYHPTLTMERLRNLAADVIVTPPGVIP